MKKKNTRPENQNGNLLGTFIIASIVYIVLGIFMVMHPGKVETGICIAFGIVLTIYGVINVISFFINKDSDENLFLELVIGVFAAAFGVFTLFVPTLIQDILLISIGIIVIIDGIMNIKRSFSLKAAGVKKWWIFTAVSGLSVLAGLLTIIFRESLGELLIIILGINLIYEGISGLVILFMVSRAKKNTELMVIEAEFEEH